jgi:hypothetical protein
VHDQATAPLARAQVSPVVAPDVARPATAMSPAPDVARPATDVARPAVAMSPARDIAPVRSRRGIVAALSGAAIVAGIVITVIVTRGHDDALASAPIDAAPPAIATAATPPAGTDPAISPTSQTSPTTTSPANIAAAGASHPHDKAHTTSTSSKWPGEHAHPPANGTRTSGAPATTAPEVGARTTETNGTRTSASTASANLATTANANAGAAAPGLLAVASDQTAVVVIDGVRRKSTPFQTALPIGHHDVAVELAEGGGTLRAPVDIAVGRKTKCMAKAGTFTCDSPQ